ncbi:MAG TPA: flagellar FlbD family protein [Candidatus Binataceae bacterium]|nr:flagellar FlbD family protein [Candidatus Binataceae bacterium]
MNFGNARTCPVVNEPPDCADSVTGSVMIRLTRLNNSTVTVNSDLIKFVEEIPDTVITLLNGEKILVRECVDQIVDRVIEFRRELLSATVTLSGVRAAAIPLTCISPHAHKESEG